MEWETKLHDREQEVKLLTQKYEKKLRSMQAELEERDQTIMVNSDNLNKLNAKCNKLTTDLETM